jgi:peptide/nickel transport system substrate-binding protein
MSILEEGTISIVAPIMVVFNNLVMFDPNVKQNSLKSIVPDLAESWAWSEDGTELTFKLRDGVKWHDGKPFTAQDVKCTFDRDRVGPVSSNRDCARPTPVMSHRAKCRRIRSAPGRSNLSSSSPTSRSRHYSQASLR